jgi:hypothetical protein
MKLPYLEVQMEICHMTLNDYAQQIADLIKSRPAKMDFQRLMYRIYVLSEIAEGERAIQLGQWRTQEEVAEGLWRKNGSKSAGAKSRNGGSTRSSKRSNKTRH